jgi:predicted Ser/Thr protein kinase
MYIQQNLLELRENTLNKISSENYTNHLIDYHIKLLPLGRHCSYIDLCMLDGVQVVRKIFFTRPTYRRERDAFLRLDSCKHIPKLINYADESLTTITEYISEDVRMKFKSNSERKQYLHLVKIAYDDMLNNFGFHHNDLKWRNICIKDNKAYFIDLSRLSDNLIDEDSEKILEQIGIKRNNFDDLFTSKT